MRIGSSWRGVPSALRCTSSSRFVHPDPHRHHPLPNVPVQKASAENIHSGKVKIQVIGKQANNPDAVLEFLKKRMVDVEKQRDELKPQWLREWEDSREPGQSASS